MQDRKNIAATVLSGLLLVGVLAVIIALVASAPNPKKTDQSNNSISNFYSNSSMTFEYKPELTAKLIRVTTNKGTFDIELASDIAPKTTNNFAQLVQQGFYNGLTFHRYEPGFVIQGGDPEGTGMGGPGYTVPAEFSPYLQHEKGAVAMARQGDAVNPEKASSGSQFYIALDDINFLDGEYTVFGKVVNGMDVVEQLRRGDTMDKLEIIN